MRKTKISNGIREPFKWDVWGNLAVQIVLVLITIFALKESQKSTKTAQDALALQSKQTIESQKKDSISSIQDSIRNKNSIELSNQQILALKAQAKALERGVRNTEITQRPYLDIMQLGFHSLSDGNFVFLYKVVNYGFRPVILEEVKLYLFDQNFHYSGVEIFEGNTLLIKDGKAQTQKLKLLIDGIECKNITKESILKLQNTYFCFVLTYYDPFLKKRFETSANPIILKWVERPEADLFLSLEGIDKYFGVDLCSDIEESKVLNAYKKVKR